MAEEDPPYEVGYGKPPRSTQFRKGASGNPKGRPKGSKNFMSIVIAESRKKVRINGPRGVHTVTKLEATVMQLGNKSAQGDLRASRDFLALVQVAEATLATASDAGELNELDQTTIDIFRRLMGTPAENEREEN